MKVTICIGSACHLKGSREIIAKLQKWLLRMACLTRWI